ncbi:E3 ubiquitin-protein ligase NEURL3-like [Anableps anableps]
MSGENNNKEPAPKMTHSCGRHCLGPLTFHPQVVGDRICLSEGYRLAERTENTFRGGVVFSSRPVRTCEKVRVLVEKHVANWSGAMRVGFTNVSPIARSLPLPSMAMPDLTQTPGHWAIPVSESCCQEGSVLEFWVSDRGHLYMKFQNAMKQKLPVQVDLDKPLWAMIDVYGQTCSIFLLGSKKKDLFFKRTSCPGPKPLIRLPSSFGLENTALSENSDDCVSCLSMDIQADDTCVVCMVRETAITLACGHRCLCHRCTSRVLMHFGTCPLCRLEISTPLMMGR